MVETENAAAIKEAERLGAAIYEHDRAAWVSTDVLVEMLGNNIAKEVGGWIETSSANGVRVLYFNPDATRPVYAVDVKNGAASRSDVTEYPADAEFTVAERALIDARQLALGQEFPACSRNYNTVTLEADGGNHFVYLLAATTDPNQVFFGGHYRFRVNQAGDGIDEFRKYTNSCLVLPLKPDLPPGATLAALIVSQILTPHPTEIHAWKSLELGMDIYVVTPDNNTLWQVSQGKIKFSKTIERKSASNNRNVFLTAGESREADPTPLEGCSFALASESAETGCGNDVKAFAPERGIRDLTPVHTRAK